MKSLGLELGAEQPIGDPSGAKRIVAHEVAVASIEIGDARFRGITAVAMDRKRFDAGEDLKGALGLPLFTDCLFTLDYPKKEIFVAKGELPADGAGVIAYDADGPLPRVEIALDGKKILAHIDSGAPSGWGFPKSFLEGRRRVRLTRSREFRSGTARFAADVAGRHGFRRRGRGARRELQRPVSSANVGYRARATARHVRSEEPQDRAALRERSNVR